MPGHGGKFMQKTIREPPGYRQLVFALEFLNRRNCRLVKSPGCAQLTVAEVREGTLHRCDARGRGDRRSNEIADRIIAAGGRSLRRSNRRRARGRRFYGLFRRPCFQRPRRRRDRRSGTTIDRLRQGRRISEKRRRMPAGLQKHRVDDDDETRSARA